MYFKSLLSTAVLTGMVALFPVFSASASASPSPTISDFSPKQGPVGTTVTISGTNLANATSVTFGKTAATVTVDTSTKVDVLVPTGATTSHIKVTTAAGRATTRSKFVVTAPLGGVMSLSSDDGTSCALLTSSGVDCWGFGRDGELGDGVFYTNNPEDGSALSVAVRGPGGSGTLSGVVSLASDGGGYCALLITGGVDCWGQGSVGALGNGVFYEGSADPVAVHGVGSSGTLGHVVSLASDGSGYCAVLATGGVDCWGDGYWGDLGNGVFYDTGHEGSAVPVAVLGVGGSGILGGVRSLTGDRYSGSYCALLTSNGVDCWGYGGSGELGDGVSKRSAVPVAVLGVDGSGTLGSAVSLASDDEGSYCALLTSSGVDCWGFGGGGALGDGVFKRRSAVPVAVLGVGGIGTLGGVVSLASEGSGSYCALLTSSGVDCWGYGIYGELGNGVVYAGTNVGSAVPVAVLGVGGGGTLGGVVSITGDGYGGSYCALLTSDGADCWGYGFFGGLGDGVFADSDVPVAVLGIGGSGYLGGLASLAGDGGGECSLLTSGAVDCWGYGKNGQLGDGVFYKTGNQGSAVPVTVVTAIPS